MKNLETPGKTGRVGRYASERLHASTFDAKFSIYVTRDRELVQHHDVYA